MARPPDFLLKVKLKPTEAPVTGSTMGRVGAGWRNDDGSISIQLDVGTALDWRLSREAYITLFPAGGRDHGA